MNRTKLENKIIKILKKIIGNKSKKLHEPIFFGNEKKYVLDCIKSSFVSSVGKYVNIFENKVKKYTKSKNAVGIINGTCALQIVLQSIGVKSNDEVIVPSLSFIATANAVRHCGAFPNFVDVEKKTLGICAGKLEKYLKKISIKKKNFLINKKTGRKITALIAVHVFGMPCKIEEIKKVCKKFRIKVIEDAAEAIGSFYKKKHLGSFSEAGVISFNGNKTITSGNGAMVITENKQLANRIRHLSTQAKIKHIWEYNHDDVGYNYRLSNINAAIGCAQMEKLPIILRAKRKNFQRYYTCLNKLNFVQILKEPPLTKSNYWLITMKLNINFLKKNILLKKLYDLNFLCRPVWKPLHTLKIFIKYEKDNCINAEEIYDQILNLPSSPEISL